jgi:Phosphotransferase enzyme family
MTVRADTMASYFPWRFELDMYQSGIGSLLPPGMRMPVLHHVKHAGDDHIGLWWEFITQRPGPWQLDDYRRAAYLLGRLAARRREGAAANNCLPAVARDHSAGSALRTYTQTRVMRGMLPMLRHGSLWRDPAIAGALRQAGDPGLPDAMLALAARLPRILDMLDALPQTHAHGDASPQNLLLPADEPGTVVVIDWGFGTLLPIGFDLGQLLTGLAQAGQADPAELPGIDAVIFPSYLDGLAVEDYHAREHEVRAGYIGGMAARSALVALPFELLGGPGPGLGGTGPSEDAPAQIVRRLRLTRVLVDMAGEIR